jgi:ATP-dependent Clp protease protease subunit
MDKSGLDGVTVNSLINSVTWMTADQALNLGFVDAIEDYSDTIINSALIKKYTDTAPAVYQRCINKILNKKSNMNMDNRELIERTTSVLDKIMNFFKKVVNKQTITDKGTLHHTGEMCEGAEVYQDEDMTSPAVTDTYTTAEGEQLAVKQGKVQKVLPAEVSDEDEEESMPADKFKKPVKPADVQNRLQEVKARLYAQNALLNEAKAALEEATNRLKKTREELKNEIKSDFTPEGSKRSSKAKTETQPFFAPQSPLAQNAVKKAIGK